MSSPRIAGFTLVSSIGRGAFGEVWLATRDRDGRRLAVKVAHAQTAKSAGAALTGGPAQQAVRELGVLRGVQHPHLVGLHDSLWTDDGRLALVLDLVDGGSLGSVVAARGHLRAGEVVTVLAPLARAVADLHAAGVVHADLSPANILFRRDGKPMLSDLGSARLIGEHPGPVHATTGFLAPEVADGGVPSPGSDVYALAALGWFALAGTAPGPASARGELTDVAPDVPAALARAIMRGLSADPQSRPEAAQLAVDLFDSAVPEPVPLASGPDPAAQVTHRIRSGARPATEQGRQPRRAWSPFRSRGAALGAGGVVLAVGAIAALLWSGLPGSAALSETLSPDPNPSSTSAATSPTTTTSATATSATMTSSATAAVQTPAAQPTSSRPPGQSPSASRDGLRLGARAVLQQLADARATALTARNPLLLAAVDLPGSAHWQQDAELIGSLVAARATYDGLRFEVQEAVLTASPSTAPKDNGTDQTARVRARVGTSAYTAVGADGSRRAVPARTEAVLLTLSWTSAGWRITAAD